MRRGDRGSTRLHVLDGYAGAFGYQNKVLNARNKYLVTMELDGTHRKSMYNHHSLRLFDDVWKDTQSRRDTLISSRKVHAPGGARIPDYVRRVDSILDLKAAQKT